MRKLNKILWAGFIGLTIGNGTPLMAASQPILGYTHMVPTPLTLNAGTLVYGTYFGYGITDFLQIGTNIIADINQFYNADAKLNFLDTEDMALSAIVGWDHYNYNDISATNPDLAVTTWSPGLVYGYALAPRFAWFAKGVLNYSDVTLVNDGIETSGLMRGANIGSDVSWAYGSKGTKSKELGNVLSTGVSYDVSYKIFGVGLSHHWGGFQLGFHYYLNADKNAILPIIAGGGSVSL